MTVNGNSDIVYSVAGAVTSFNGTNECLNGSGGTVYVDAGDTITATGTNNVFSAAAGSTVDFGGGAESGDVYGNDVTIVATSGTTGIQAMGYGDAITAVSGDSIGVYGTGDILNGSGITVDTVYSTCSVMLAGTKRGRRGQWQHGRFRRWR